MGDTFETLERDSKKKLYRAIIQIKSEQNKEIRIKSTICTQWEVTGWGVEREGCVIYQLLLSLLLLSAFFSSFLSLQVEEYWVVIYYNFFFRLKLKNTPLVTSTEILTCQLKFKTLII